MAPPRLPAHRADQSVQAHLALSHGTVAWHTLPSDVRDRVVALWIELLRGHATHSPMEREA
jgi:hypothetical protein